MDERIELLSGREQHLLSERTPRRFGNIFRASPAEVDRAIRIIQGWREKYEDLFDRGGRVRLQGERAEYIQPELKKAKERLQTLAADIQEHQRLISMSERNLKGLSDSGAADQEDILSDLRQELKDLEDEKARWRNRKRDLQIQDTIAGRIIWEWEEFGEIKRPAFYARLLNGKALQSYSDAQLRYIRATAIEMLKGKDEGIFNGVRGAKSNFWEAVDRSADTTNAQSWFSKEDWYSGETEWGDFRERVLKETRRLCENGRIDLPGTLTKKLEDEMKLLYQDT